MASSSDSVGDRVRGARVAKGLGLRELARLMDVAPSYLSDIEYDRRVPSEGVLQRIAEVLGLNYDDLLAAAGRIGEDTERYLKMTPAAGALFRRVTEARLSDEDLKSLTDEAERLASDRRQQEGDG